MAAVGVLAVALTFAFGSMRALIWIGEVLG